MTDFQQTLLELTENLGILQVRQAKLGDDAPIALHHQINDHREAIALTKQAVARQLSEAEWREALRPLLVDIRARNEAHPDWGVSIGSVKGSIIGSIIAGRDVVIQNYYQLADPAPVDKATLTAAGKQLAATCRLMKFRR